MTSGYENYDQFQITTLGCGLTWVGFKGYKTWSGGDHSVRTAYPRTAYDGWGEVKQQHQSVYDPNLDRYVIVHDNKWRHYVRPMRSKEVDRDLGEHPYTMEASRTSQHEMTYFHPWPPPPPPEPPPPPVIGTVESCFGPPIESYSWSSNADIDCVNDLHNDIHGNDFDMGVFLGEGGEVLHMVAENAYRIGNMYHHLRRGDYSGACRALTGRILKGRKGVDSNPPQKWMAEKLLELRYGWEPLLQDVYGGAQWLAHHLSVPKKKSYIGRKTVQGSVHSSSPDVSYYAHSYALSRKQIKAIFTEDQADIAQNHDLVNPSLVAWELMPYSFVADWFIPIGDYLAARGQAAGLIGTFVISRKDEMMAGDLVLVIPYNGRDESYFKTRTTLTRTVTSSLEDSVPLPTVKPFGKIASWIHAENAVGLVVANHGSGHR